ncbi:aminopeptidase YwaD precursor [Clostridium saccharobutylicum]|uniref:M28 family metallopeptidase n=1 Tax=Clostridium saccharobutylicum TaxID=169679 RepID=UPI0009838D68|nr:M28 family metallopeptidase [Clostridium saccharobutylicum]AQS08457.1 aminopeptidase YwaD precursor [Clostridium saccharobutylicum]NSB89462.1 hypothetical protein [Clostridium saccharobutylicum]NYC29207.1 hypothetical protein [Clostridium saccharobutylicum]OOM15501.1 aminopeptidase YwaD precursor [Clostridium saccharobutylicum]
MKINIKKSAYYISLAICFTLLTYSIFVQTTYYKFNPQNVKNTIKILTSDKYEGRLTGTVGNFETSNLIEESFKNDNLSSLNNSYKESFEVTTPIKNNDYPKLTIQSGTKIIGEYKYGTDFKDDMLNFRTTNVTFTKDDIVEIYVNSIIIKHNNNAFLFRVASNNNFNFRSSFNVNSPYEFSITITTKLYNDILNSLRNNDTVTINLPYTLKEEQTSNVIGVLKGTSNSLPPLVISAHFDHLGIDALGNHYNGALDNASGTAFMLELSKSLSSFSKPKRDIIFVGLTGEEFGLLGSQKFANDYLNIIRDGKVINFDMIGAPNTPLTLMTGSICKDTEDDSTSELLDSLKLICSKKNINYDVEFRDSSDHASFSNAGIDAVTLCNSDISRIHTPNDTIDYIDTNTINQVYSIIQQEIYSYAYNNFFLLLYNPKLIVLLSILFIFLITFPKLKPNH